MNRAHLIYTDSRTPGASALLDVLERCFVVASLTLFMKAVVPLLRQGSKTGTTAALDQSDYVMQIIFFSIYVITGFLILSRWKQFVRVFSRDKLLLLLVIVALASVAWSFEPEVTLRRGVALVGTTMFGFYLASRYSLEEQLQLLAWALGIVTVLSLLFAVTLPGYGISREHPGAWQGVFVHKNQFGSRMALAALVFLLLALSKGLRIAWIGFGLSVSLLLLSSSRTALIVFLASLLLLALFRTLHWHFALATPVLIVVVLSVGGLMSVLIGDAAYVLGILGRDITLTDRADLWPLVLDKIQAHPWIGYGYSGFWHGWEGESAYVWLRNFRFDTAHNGYLDLWLDLGLLGLSVFALGFLFSYLRAIVWARRTPSVLGLWPATFLSYLLLYGLTESPFLNQNNISWVLYVMVAASLTFRHPQLNRRTDRTSTMSKFNDARTAKLPAT